MAVLHFMDLNIKHKKRRKVQSLSHVLFCLLHMFFSSFPALFCGQHSPPHYRRIFIIILINLFFWIIYSNGYNIQVGPKITCSAESVDEKKRDLHNGCWRRDSPKRFKIYLPLSIYLKRIHRF